MALHLALMAAPAVLSLGTTVFSWLKGRKVKKNVEAQMAQVRADQQRQIAQMMSQYQGANTGAVGGMNANYMAPSGMAGGQGYGPAGAGYYPQAFA
ncbi:MAG: hypothetical protein WC314_01810 [Vulcanimicrobiota bacterium]